VPAAQVGALPLVEYLGTVVTPQQAADAAEAWRREQTETAIAAAQCVITNSCLANCSTVGRVGRTMTMGREARWEARGAWEGGVGCHILW
jgi:hypothetical protein